MPQSHIYFNEGRTFLSAPQSYDLIQIPRDTLINPPDLFDQSFLTNNFSADNALVLPPVVVKNSSGQTVIVDGCKRLSSINPDQVVLCLLINNLSLDAWQIGLLRIAANKARTFSPAEKIVYLRFMRQRTEDADYSALCRLLGFGTQDVHELTPLLDAPVAVVEAVLQGALHAPCVRDFCLLSAENQAAFLNAFSTVRLSLQTQREFLEWLPEIAFIKKTTITALLCSSDIQSILNNAKTNNPQKIEALKNQIYALRFPQVTAMQQVWQELANNHNPDSKRVNFSHSPAFEKNRLEIKISVTESEQIKKIISDLNGIDEKSWETLIYPG